MTGNLLASNKANQSYTKRSKSNPRQPSLVSDHKPSEGKSNKNHSSVGYNTL